MWSWEFVRQRQITLLWTWDSLRLGKQIKTEIYTLCINKDFVVNGVTKTFRCRDSWNFTQFHHKTHCFEGLLPPLGLVSHVDFSRLADNPLVLNLMPSFVICFHPGSTVALKSYTSVTCTKLLLLWWHILPWLSTFWSSQDLFRFCVSWKHF